MSSSQEKIIQARGETSKDAIEPQARLLGESVLAAQIIDPSEIQKLRQESVSSSKEFPYTWSEITSPKQFIVKEHFEEYRALRAPRYTTPIASRAFGLLVNGGTRHLSMGQTPEEFGLILQPREALGFPPIENNIYAMNNKYAVQAGSFLEVSPRIFKGLGGYGGRAKDFLLLIRDALQMQIET